ncbi:MAG TPA: hypothetical protein VFS31_00875, partial [Chitinophagaceae bacterium]|nr:hypothetical protein [Chitinophagaceae bacterium]
NHCHQRGVKIGVALLQQTTAETILPALNYVDHVLIFAGNLGHYGGQANMHMQNKIQTLKQHKPQLEIGWDGGINDQNISELVLAGVDVFNVGGYIQDSNNPERAFRALQRIAEETGTT